MPHKPVLLDAVIHYLNPRPGATILDATIGSAGHARAIAERLGQSGILLGIDQDEEAIERAKRNIGSSTRAVIIKGNFRDLDQIIRRQGWNQMDGVLFDLGVSRDQLEAADRGFSFMTEGPLDMRMDQENPTTAGQLVNHLNETDLADLFFKYGEERKSRIIAKRIVEKRKQQPFRTTFELRDVVSSCFPRRHAKIHPATRVFQALRVVVNRELECLEEGLGRSLGWVTPGGRVVVLSFHSLEDRLVKRRFRQASAQGIFKILTPKVVTADRKERSANPSARSAKLRAVERI